MVQNTPSSTQFNPAMMAQLAQLSQTPEAPSAYTPDATPTATPSPTPADSFVATPPATGTASKPDALPTGFKKSSPIISSLITAVGGFAGWQVVQGVGLSIMDAFNKEAGGFSFGKAVGHLKDNIWLGAGAALGLGIVDFMMQNKKAHAQQVASAPAPEATPANPLPTPSTTAQPA
jgi:hypothetical protein